jgi:hypothetical protein
MDKTTPPYARKRAQKEGSAHGRSGVTNEKEERPKDGGKGRRRRRRRGEGRTGKRQKGKRWVKFLSDRRFEGGFLIRRMRWKIMTERRAEVETTRKRSNVTERKKKRKKTRADDGGWMERVGLWEGMSGECG